MEYRTLRLAVDGPIARLTLTRPEAGNRIDLRALREIAEAAEAIATTEGVILAVFAADGPDFCAGWDEAASAELLSLRIAGDTSLIDPFACIAALPCPVLAALHGAVESAGLELALCADIRIAGQGARFALPDVASGRLPLAGGSQRLPRVVGQAVATSMLLLGDSLDAPTALRAGLVSRLVPAADLEAETDALARHIASRGPIALRFIKEAVHHGAEMTLDQALRYETDLSVILQTTADRAEGVRAFLEKRPPTFENR